MRTLAELAHLGDRWLRLCNSFDMTGSEHQPTGGAASLAQAFSDVTCSAISDAAPSVWLRRS
jgi:hypothetical protein